MIVLQSINNSSSENVVFIQDINLFGVQAFAIRWAGDI